MRYVIRRIVLYIPIILLVTLLVFLLMRIIPGDPALLILAGTSGDGSFKKEDLVSDSALKDGACHSPQEPSGSVGGDLFRVADSWCWRTPVPIRSTPSPGHYRQGVPYKQETSRFFTRQED